MGPILDSDVPMSGIITKEMAGSADRNFNSRCGIYFGLDGSRLYMSLLSLSGPIAISRVTLMYAFKRT